MRRVLSGSLLLALMSGALAVAQTQHDQDAVTANLKALATRAAPMQSPTHAADQLDFVFLASDKPVLIRLHVRHGDRPYDAAWNDWMNKIFAWFDKDNDGWLSEKEVASVPSAQKLQFMIQGSIGAIARGGDVKLAMLTTNKGGKVSKDEFRDYYKKNNHTPLRFSVDNSPATTAKQINDVIYKRLGRDKAGRLTKDDLAKMPVLLRQLDENEDEMLTSQEINTEGGQQNYDLFFARPVQMAQPTLQPEPGWLQIRPSSKGSEHVAQLLTRYDRNKDGKIAKSEMALEAKVFDALDKNKDGFLDQKELVGVFQSEPDLIFRIRVGPMTAPMVNVPTLLSKVGLGKPAKVAGTPERIEVFNPKKRDMPLANVVKKVNGENVSFTLGDSKIQLQGQQRYFGQTNGSKQFYVQEYEMFAGTKGYVGKDQEKNNNGRPFLFQVFPFADKDNDGKLTRRELNGWFDLVEDGTNAVISLSVTDNGRSLFNVIDTNADGRLSIRETRSGWDRIKPLCKDEKGLRQGDLPRSLRVTIGQGNFFYQAPPPVVFGGPMMVSAPGYTGGAPVWFRKMDRNNDSDLSPKEWLGTEEEFRTMDLDGDGLISVEEAKKYEAKLAKRE